MPGICGARTRRGGYCQQLPSEGRLRCFRHGGAPGNGCHLTEDKHHSESLAKARAAVRWPHAQNSAPGGLVRAATGARLPNGRFAPNAAPQPKRVRIVAKALAGVIATQKERRMAKEATLQIVSDDPSVDEPWVPAPELGTTAMKPEAAASASGTLALRENSGEVVWKKSSPDPSQEPALPAIAAAGVPAQPRADTTKGERLSHNVDLSLEFTRQLLELPFDPENLKLLGHQKDAALMLISQQIRIESERLRAPPARGGSVEEFYRRYDGGSSEKDEQ